MVLTEATGITIRELFPNSEMLVYWFNNTEVTTDEAITMTGMDFVKFAITLRNNSGSLDYLAHTIDVSNEYNHIKVTDSGESDVEVTGLAVGYADSYYAGLNTATTTTEAGGTTTIRKLAPGPAEGILCCGDANIQTDEGITITPIQNGVVEGAYILKVASGVLTSESTVIDVTNEVHKIKDDATNVANVDVRFLAWGDANASSGNTAATLTAADTQNVYKIAPGPSEYKMYYFEATMSTNESVTFAGLDVIDGAIAYKYASGATTEQTLTIEVTGELNKVKNTTTNSDVEVRGIVWGRKNAAGTLLS